MARQQSSPWYPEPRKPYEVSCVYREHGRVVSCHTFSGMHAVHAFSPKQAKFLAALQFRKIYELAADSFIEMKVALLPENRVENLRPAAEQSAPRPVQRFLFPNPDSTH